MIKKEIVICTDDKIIGSVFTITANTPKELFETAYALADECNNLLNGKHKVSFNLDVLFPEPPVELANQMKALDEKERKAKEEAMVKPKKVEDKRIGVG